MFAKVERMYVRLNRGRCVPSTEQSALKLASLDAHDDSLPPATRLIANAFEMKENCGSVIAKRHIP